jgi:valyl-tRNA synthetase
MSKSLGNSPDPLELIAKYSADGVRVGMLLCSPAGNDILFDEILTEQGRNFANKIWKAFRLVKTWEVDNSAPQPESSKLAVKWFENRLQQEMQLINDHFDKYRISDALMAVYNLFWDEFSSWYLEIIKPGYRLPIDRQTYNSTLRYFDDLIHLLHPFMPFITEEIWHQIKERKNGESLMIEPMPIINSFDDNVLHQFEKVKEVIINIRTIRKDKNISFKEELDLAVIKGDDGYYQQFNPVLEKMGFLSEIKEVPQKIENSASFFIKSSEFFLVINANINIDEEIAKLETELSRLEKFLETVMNKLNNEKFVANAPEKVLELENRKKTDTKAKINALKESMEGLRIIKN